ncbi:MAG: rod shape-determining protein MreC [Gammaproteobacteria bacterium]|nr:rod shape-determining protein MreC [Gammaproteobacteria bacterium]MDH3559826.1 rod shape-determining protein MreC [Gammaproteobacteria bacterium]
MKLIFTQGPSITTRLVLLVTLSITLMMMDHRQNHIDSLRAGLSLLVYPLQLAVEMPGAVSEWFRESLATRRQLQEENASLRTQMLMLKARGQKLQALETENIRLRELLDSAFMIGERVLVAELMSVDLDPYKHQVLINKGELDKIYPGQPILDADGVMGQVVHVGPYTSTAILITDTSHALPVQVNRNGIRTIALGSGTINRLELPYIPNNADIQPGDLLVTSGLGGRFPPGYPVAVVQGVQHDPGRSFAAVVATPSAKLNRSREILLVWPGDTSTLETSSTGQTEAPLPPEEQLVAPEEAAATTEENP